MFASPRLFSPLALLAGAAAISGQAEAAPIVITPNADFSTTPYNLSFDGGTTTSYTFFKASPTATDGSVNTYANSVKGLSIPNPTAFGVSNPIALPFPSGAPLVGGSSVALLPFTNNSDVYYGLEFTVGNDSFEGSADVRNHFTLYSVTYEQVPEPASLALLATGAAGLLALRRRQAKAR